MKRRVAKTLSTDKGESLPLYSKESKSSNARRGAVYKAPLSFLLMIVALVALFLYDETFMSDDYLNAYPRFYIPSVDATAKWEYPMVHIVNTRFMQEQGDLVALAKARLSLFQVFTLPTMARQTTQDFIWIVKTDPNLDRRILREMIQELKPYPNFFLVASNNNYRVNEAFPGGWRDGQEVEDLSKSRVYTGNQQLLEAAMSRANTHDVILETRLDADDGLHLSFIEALQKTATESFVDNMGVVPKWKYWCSRRHIEWHFSEKKQGEDTIWDEIVKFGGLAGIQHTNLCITPGFTVGFAPGTREAEVPIFAHDKLIKRVRDLPNEDGCGLDKPSDCLEFVENFVFEAIRSRTPTSAGMLRVEIESKELATDSWLYYAFISMVQAKFGIPLQHLEWTNRMLSENLVEIARDNLQGQCTTGHSCKVRSIHSLSLFLTLPRRSPRSCSKTSSNEGRPLDSRSGLVHSACHSRNNILITVKLSNGLTQS